jgi:hypothetical protein
VQDPDADHLFLGGTGPPTPSEYQKPGPRNPAVIAAWITRTDTKPL